MRPLAGVRSYRKVQRSKDVGRRRVIVERGGSAAERPNDAGDVTVERSGALAREVKLALAELEEGVTLIGRAGLRPETGRLASSAQSFAQIRARPARGGLCP